MEELQASAAASSTADAGPSSADPNDPVAQSLICNDCGKKFRGTTQAQFHAEKSGHENFSESTEEIAPLTEEEKKAKLDELRERLREKRSGESEQDKADKKRNEVRLPQLFLAQSCIHPPSSPFPFLRNPTHHFQNSR